MTQLHTKKRKPYYLFTLLGIFLLILIWWGFTSVLMFTNSHEFHKNRIVSMTFKWPISITKKVDKVVVQKAPIADYNGIVDTPLKQYIVDKFGVADAKIALGIAQEESNFNPEAININTNNTIDVGVFQINSVHFKQQGCSLQEVVFANKNVDCAYNIWLANGKKWTPWVTYNTGSYLAHL